ncbi:S-adenosyl-L-methionine-dependent methyltransferase [Coemansia reversa NRRL 1564]|uniref:type I protein arginine methyltransferase n=1 Tax=Coemansia reversa (strain ATCC 12441 / NRRL 1564) TaxID=763665 RepID=A0A2G5BGZ9_COERN|nr:S-adenosyl-L-methionine-dependent methyltransferase [Coemansia reversa NRRL 1564]|eukprot:PIA18298.1 S-adenosyl-L-methionine-dependent methyltransferase [Coemansia reversa NRRL 1564]
MSGAPNDGETGKRQRTSSAGREDSEVLDQDSRYFQCYSRLHEQQNMLCDHVRTSSYHSAITLNGPSLFRDRMVMDLGAGSGILSFFAVQAGAKHVYAVEASDMADKMRVMLDAAKRNGAASRNAYLADRITVVNSKVEEPRLLPELPKVDVIISEPIGVMLVHERMLESYIYARDKFLRPGGAMMPSSGTIHLAPLSDAMLWNETITSARFWQQNAFYGVDLNPYFAQAFDECFSSPVVGCFNPNALMGESVQHEIDFHTIQMAELKKFSVPIEWNIKYTGLMHGIASWFDLAFIPPASALRPGTTPSATFLSTSPRLPVTHWHQARLLLKQPLAVNAGQVVRGFINMKANSHRSYDISAQLICLELEESAAVTTPEELSSMLKIHKSRARTAFWHLQAQVYNYSYTGEQSWNSNPEEANLYLPVDSLLASSDGRDPQSSVISSVRGTSSSFTDFLVTTTSAANKSVSSNASNAISTDLHADSSAMQLQ